MPSDADARRERHPLEHAASGEALHNVLQASYRALVEHVNGLVGHGLHE